MFSTHFFSDSRIRQSLSWHEWNYSSVLPPQWRGCPLSNFWGEDFCRHLPLSGGALQDHQAPQGLLHGGGRCGAASKNEPTARTTVQVDLRSFFFKMCLREDGNFELQLFLCSCLSCCRVLVKKKKTLHHEFLDCNTFNYLFLKTKKNIVLWCTVP